MAIAAVAGLASIGSAMIAAGTLAIGWGAALGAFALGAGLSMVSRALAPQPDLGDQMRGITQTTREPAGTRKIIYGKIRVGGNVVFISHSGTDNKYLHMAIVFATHEIQAYDEIWFNDNKIWTASGGFQGDWGTYVTIDRKFGTSGQSASTQLVNANSRWTTDHKLSGIAYIAFKLEWNQDKFPQGVPNITAVVRGKKVYDPRNQVTAYSQNPALCLRDYMMSEYGLDEIAANIDNTSVGDAADLCDEQVSLAGGGTQDRYQCNGVIDTANQIKANIEQLLSSMGGKLTYSGGKYFIDGAEYKTPTHTFTEADVVSDIQTQTKQSRRGIYNGVKGIFVSEEKNYKVLDYPAQISSSYATEDGDPLYLDMPLPFVTNNLQAQRLAKIALLRSRQQTVMTMTVNLKGLQVKVGDTIQVTNDRLNYSNKAFEVIDYSLAINDGDTLGVNLVCIETASAIYDWTTSDEEDFLSGGELPLYDGRTVDNVTSLQHSVVGLKGPDGKLITSVDLTWTAPDDAFVEFYVVTYEKDSDGDVYEVQTRNPRIRLSELTIGSAYTFTVKAQNLIGVRSSGTTLNVASLAGDTTAPAVPTSPTTTGGIRQITVEWTEATDEDLALTLIYYNDTDNLSTATRSKTRGEEFVYTLADGETSPKTKYFWLSSIDYSGNESAKTSSFTGTSVRTKENDIADGEVTTGKIENGAVTEVKIEDGAVTAGKITVTDLEAINADLGDITGGTLQAGGVTDPIPSDIFTRSSNQNIPTGNENGAFIDLNGGSFVFGDADSFISFAENEGATAFELDIKGVLAPTKLDFAGVTDTTVMPSNIKASGYTDASIGKAALSDEAYDEIARRVGNTGGFYTTATGFYLGSTKNIELASAPDHGTDDIRVRVAINDVFTAPANFAANSNGVKITVKLFAKKTTDSAYLSTHQIGTTQTFVASPTLLQYATRYTIDESYEVTLVSGTDIEDNTDYDFKVELTRLANPNAFKDYNNGGANDSTGTPVTLEVSEGTTVVATGGNANTLDSLDSTQFLRSDADDTLTGDLTLVGALKMGDTRRIELGDDTDLKISHSGGGGTVENDTGNLTIKNRAVDGDIYFQSDDGTGSNTDTYFYLDGGEKKVKFNEEVVISDDLTVTGSLTITGNIDQYNVTDLDVTDKTITVNSGSTQALSDGAGLIVDRGTAADASITWDETNDEFDLSHGASIDGHLLVSSLGAFGNSTLDPDAYGSYAGGFGSIADGGGWVARGLFIHGGATGDAAAIGHNGSNLYFGIQNGSSANSMDTWLTVNPTKVANFAAQVNVTGHGNSSQWNTAYGWGNHASQGYITNSTASLDAGKITSGTFDSARIPTPTSGDWWNNGYVRVLTDGVMEVGKYLDFHTSDDGTTDFDVRITASSGAIAIGGTVTWSGGSSTNANTAYTYSQVGHLPLAGGVLTGNVSSSETITADTLKITNDASDTSRHRVSVYDNNGSVSYGMMLWNSNGTSGNWATMIYGPNQSNRRISFGKITSSTFSDHGDVTESMFLDLDDNYLHIKDRLVHYGDGDTYLQFDNNRVRLIAGGTTKFDSNNTYLTAEADTLNTVTGRGSTTTNSITVGALTVEPSGSFGTGIVVNAGDTNVAGNAAKQLVLSYGGSSSTDYAHSIRTRHDSAASATNTIEFWLWNYGTDSSSTVGTLRSLVLNSSALDLKSGGYNINGTSVISSVRRFYASDGTVSKAAYSFDGDSNTGMYHYGTDQIGFTAGGSLIAYIQSGATYGLVVQSKISATGGNSDNWNTAYGWGDHSTAGYLETNDNITVGTISSGVITSTGTSTFDGIIVDGDDNAFATAWGTAPTAIIGGFSSGNHDGNNQLTDFRMAVISKDTNGGNTPVMQRNQAWVTGGVSGEAYNSAARWDLGRWENSGTDARSRLDLYLADDTHTWDHVMTWRAEGSNATRVGINTKTPTATLDVNGAITSSGQFTTAGSITAGNASTALGFYVGTTQVIQGSTRNLVNIGTISSGAITSSGAISARDDYNISTQGGAQLVLYDNTTDTLNMRFGVDTAIGASGGGSIQVTQSGVSNDRDLKLNPYGGKVGVNVGSTATLNYNFNVSGTSYVSGKATFDDAVVSDSLHIRGDANSAYTESNMVGGISLWGPVGQSTSQIMFKPTDAGSPALGNHGFCTDSYNTYFVMDTTNRGWVFRNATTNTNVASISNTGGAAFNNGIKIGTQTIVDSSRNLTNIGTISSGAITTSGTLNFTANPAYIRNDQDNSAQIIISAKNSSGSAQQVRWDAANASSGAWRPEVTNVSNLGLTNRIWNILYVNDIRVGSGNNQLVDSSRNVFSTRGKFTTAVHHGSTGYWKSRDNGGGTQYVLEYSTSDTLADTNIKWRVFNSGVTDQVGALRINGTTVIDSSGNLTNIGTISSGAITSTGTSSFQNFKLTDSSKMGFGQSPAGGSVNHTASGREGIFWHTNKNDYGIFRTSGTWASPNFQQLQLDWDTGIILNGGSSYGKSGVDIQAQGTSKVFVKDSHTYFNSIDLAISHSNSSHGAGTYFRGDSTHFVLGLTNGNTFYLNYNNTSGQFRLYGSDFYYNNTVILDSSLNLKNINSITASGSIISSSTSQFANIRLTDASKMGFGTVKAGSAIGHNATTDEGIFWHTDNSYGIYRTSGNWASPDYQQLRIKWPTGIELDGGSSHGKSGVNVVNSELMMNGDTVIDGQRNVFAQDISVGANGTITRSNHHSGHLEGSYNNVGANGSKTNPIYTIGSGYNPSETGLQSMYGIGYARRDQASFLSDFDGTAWGLYVAADGDARIFLNATNGILAGTGGFAVDDTTVISSTRRFYADTGTSAKAAYSFDGESNTGWYKPAAGEIAFISQGVERLHVKSTGELEVPTGRVNIDGAATAFDALLLGSTAQTSYTNVTWYSNSGSAQIWKAGTGYTNWGGASAMNIYNSNSIIAFHPQATQNVLQIDSTGLNVGASKEIRMNSTTVIDGSRNATFSRLTNTGGAKLEIQDSVDGGSTRGIFMWNSADTNWGIYMGTAGAGKSLAGGSAASGLDGRTSHGIRFRVANSSSQIGFLFENSSEQALAQITGNSGNFLAKGNVTAYASDERLKTNIKPIERPLEKLKLLRGVEFDWIDGIEETHGFIPKCKHETGVIAQEVEQVIPDAISPAPFNNEYKTVEHTKIISLLIESVRSQQETIESLTKRIEELENGDN